MECPYCRLHGHPREIHGHLVKEHAEQVNTGFEENRARMFYRVQCPSCELKIEKTVKPRLKDPMFLQEFEREIRLVAFDMLLNHIDAIHRAAATGAPRIDPEKS